MYLRSLHLSLQPRFRPSLCRTVENMSNNEKIVDENSATAEMTLTPTAEARTGIPSTSISHMQQNGNTERDLNSNIERRIRNPLEGIPHDQLLRNVEKFAREHGLIEELPILNKGAIRESLLICISRNNVRSRDVEQ